MQQAKEVQEQSGTYRITDAEDQKYGERSQSNKSESQPSHVAGGEGRAERISRFQNESTRENELFESLHCAQFVHQRSNERILSIQEKLYGSS